MTAQIVSAAKEHAFNVDIAVKLGIPAALLYHEIDYWCRLNRENDGGNKKKHYKDGRTWMWLSVSGFCEMFPELSQHAIVRGLKLLQDNGLIISGHYNTKNFDRTTWYSNRTKGDRDTLKYKPRSRDSDSPPSIPSDSPPSIPSDSPPSIPSDSSNAFVESIKSV